MLSDIKVRTYFYDSLHVVLELNGVIELDLELPELEAIIVETTKAIKQAKNEPVDFTSWWEKVIGYGG